MKNLAQIQKQIIAEIQGARHIVLTSHQNPDGDAAGSVLALAHYLEDLNKEWTIFSTHELNANLQFLPKAELWQSNLDIFQEPSFDLLIALDSGDLKHAGIEEQVKSLKHDFKIINIDHHSTNAHFGHHNLVIPEASSTCEIVHDLLKTGAGINKKMATCLLTGIISDTNGFFNLATTSSAISVAAQLLMYGVNLKEINKYMLHNRPINTLRLWGIALQRLQQDKKTGIILTYITLTDLLACQTDSSAIDGVSNFLSSLAEAKENAVAILSETENKKIKVSLRTTSPLLDVSKFAKLMGGGGHTKAAGYTINGSLIKTKYGFKII